MSVYILVLFSLAFSFPEENTEAASSVAVKATSTKAYVLKSNFFKKDKTAQAIVAGRNTNASIRDFPLKATRTETKTDSFAYRVINALRMLGYVEGLNTEEYVGDEFLYPFKRLYGLSVDPTIDVAVIQNIDSLLAEKEKQDKKLGKQFPLYKYIKQPPASEPSKEHAAALFTIAFKALPKHLVVWDQENFVDFLSNQIPSFNKGIKVVKGSGETDYSEYEVCFAMLYPTLSDSFVESDRCKWKEKMPGFFWGSDYAITTTLLHEYAHYIDANLFSGYHKVSRGIIDTTKFYEISYDLGTEDIDANTQWKRYELKRPENKRNELVSAYAIGWGGVNPVTGKEVRTAYEDFAESFAMYVMEGKRFREMAKNNSILNQKYVWLKKNVFKGKEYETGSLTHSVYLKEQALINSESIATGAGNVIDYSVFLPDFVWDYRVN